MAILGELPLSAINCHKIGDLCTFILQNIGFFERASGIFSYVNAIGWLFLGCSLAKTPCCLIDFILDGVETASRMSFQLHPRCLSDSIEDVILTASGCN